MDHARTAALTWACTAGRTFAVADRLHASSAFLSASQAAPHDGHDFRCCSIAVQSVWLRIAFELLRPERDDRWAARRGRRRVALQERLERGAQRLSRPMQSALQRVHGDAERFRSVGRGQPFDVAQQNHLAVLVRQRVQRTRERLRHLAVGCALLGRRGRVGRLWRRVLAEVTAVLEPSATPRARAPRERKHPARERRPALKLAEVRRDGKKRVLEHVVGVVRVFAHPHAEPLHGGRDAREQLFHGPHITRLSALYERVDHSSTMCVTSYDDAPQNPLRGTLAPSSHVYPGVMFRMR